MIERLPPHRVMRLRDLRVQYLLVTDSAATWIEDKEAATTWEDWEECGKAAAAHRGLPVPSECVQADKPTPQPKPEHPHEIRPPASKLPIGGWLSVWEREHDPT